MALPEARSNDNADLFTWARALVRELNSQLSPVRGTVEAVNKVPTVDPHVVGEVWRDAGVWKVSAG